MPKRYEISNEEWEKIKGLFPEEAKTGRPSKWSNRIIFDAILCLTYNITTCKNIPNYYLLHQSVYSRFCKWKDFGVFKRIFYVLGTVADLENLCIDSTCVKAHPQSSGTKKGL